MQQRQPAAMPNVWAALLGAALTRRASLVALSALATLAACANAPSGEGPAPRSASGLGPGRSVVGGFLAPSLPTAGVAPRPGSGMFVRLQSPTALALRGQELLVADAAAGRVWRADLAFNTLTPLAGAPVTLGCVLMLGAEGSAWVLDAPSRQVLRFGRDGRLLQTWRTGTTAPVPAALALADGGVTLLVADGALAQWTELRSGGALAQAVLPHHADGRRVQSVSALAMVGEQLYVLDAVAGAVHRVQRDGTVLETLGAGSLDQPGAMVADRRGGIWVADALGRHVSLLRAGQPLRVFKAAELGVQHIAALAADERSLAIADRLTGTVQLFALPAEAGP